MTHYILVTAIKYLSFIYTWDTKTFSFQASVVFYFSFIDKIKLISLYLGEFICMNYSRFTPCKARKANNTSTGRHESSPGIEACLGRGRPWTHGLKTKCVLSPDKPSLVYGGLSPVHMMLPGHLPPLHLHNQYHLTAQTVSNWSCSIEAIQNCCQKTEDRDHTSGQNQKTFRTGKTSEIISASRFQVWKEAQRDAVSCPRQLSL